MFRVIYMALDIMATVCVLLSPVAIAHWLIRAFNPPDFQGFIKLGNALFDPLNQILNMLVPALTLGAIKELPSLTWAGKPISITEGVLSAVFIVLYFTFAYLASLTKVTEKKINDTASILKYKQESFQKKSTQVHEQKRISTDSRVWVYVSFAFQENATAGEKLNNYLKHGAQVLQAFPTDVLLEFNQVEPSMQYAQEAARGVLNYYATLRPMDPQPPFKIAIHSFEGAADMNQVMDFCRQIVYFTGPNKIAFSDSMKKLLDARGISTLYRFASLGFYQFAKGDGCELFNLETR